MGPFERDDDIEDSDQPEGLAWRLPPILWAGAVIALIVHELQSSIIGLFR